MEELLKQLAEHVALSIEMVGILVVKRVDGVASWIVSMKDDWKTVFPSERK
jgi:hypothetical protein